MDLFGSYCVQQSEFCEHGNKLYGAMKHGIFLTSLITINISSILYHAITKLQARMEIVNLVNIYLTPKLHLIGSYKIHRSNVFTETS
jgi:hypothetical protein